MMRTFAFGEAPSDLGFCSHRTSGAGFEAGQRMRIWPSASGRDLALIW